MDLFGFMTFLFITVDAALDMKSGKERTWLLWTRLVVGIGGLLVDGFIVSMRFI